MKQVLGLMLALAASPAVAQQTLPFAPPGTVVSIRVEERGGTVTRDLNVGAPEAGIGVFTRGTETQKRYYLPGCWDCRPGAYDQAGISGLFPLQVGRTVTFQRWLPDNPNRRWEDRATVLRQETITTPMGQVATFVIETQSRALSHTWQGRRVQWWAPSVGWHVRSEETDNGNPINVAVTGVRRR